MSPMSNDTSIGNLGKTNREYKFNWHKTVVNYIFPTSSPFDSKWMWQEQKKKMKYTYTVVPTPWIHKQQQFIKMKN